MIQWIAGILVVLGCGYLGIAYAGTVENRIHQLEVLEQMLGQMEFNIVFLLQPVPQAMKGVAGSYKGKISCLFSQVADKMIRSPDLPSENAFLLTLKEMTELRMKEEEQEILQDLFRHVGRGNKESARDGIRMTVAKLKLVREALEKEQEKDGKLWRSMGFLGGILIVLLLV